MQLAAKMASDEVD